MAGKVDQPVLSVVFAEGQRPRAAALAAGGRAAAHGCGGFMVTIDEPEAGWAEILASGLTFDCHGLAPAEPVADPGRGARIGLDAWPVGEAIALTPGPHIAAGAAMMPVLRSLIAAGVGIAAMEGVMAVCWSPARTWIEPQYFARVGGAWLAGGAFPALGLTMLRREANGALVSQGLGCLIGRELRMEPDRDLSDEALAQLAVRMIDRLVGQGPLRDAQEFVLDQGTTLLAVPIDEGSEIRVLRRRNGSN